MGLAALVLVACSPDTLATAPSDPATTGSVALELVNVPAGQRAAITVSGTSGVIETVTAPATLPDLAAGTYTFQASDIVAGGVRYTAVPSQLTVAVGPSSASGESVQFRYEPVVSSPPVSTGAITIAVAGLPSTAGAAVVVTRGGSAVASTSGSATLTGLPPDSYLVSAQAMTVDGATWTPQPAEQSVTVVAGDSAAALITYSAASPPPAGGPAGTLTVSITGLPAGAAAAVSVVAPDGSTESIAQSGDLPAVQSGAYTLNAASVTIGGVVYTASPQSQTTLVLPGSNATASVSYAVAAGGLDLLITGLPSTAAAQVTVTGPGGFSNQYSASTALPTVTPGSYVVTASPVVDGGYTFGASVSTQTITVAAGAGTSVAVDYIATTGKLTLTANAPGGWSAVVAGPGGFLQQVAAPQTLGGLAPGNYTVTAAPVTVGGSSYAPTTLSQTITVAAGSESLVNLDYYASSGGLSIAISGLPSGTGATVLVTGPGGFVKAINATTTLSGIVAGTYAITASPVASGGVSFSPSPVAQTCVVLGGSNASATVAYATTGGTLSVNVGGVPAGTAPNVLVTGPSGFSRLLTGSTAIAGVVPGVYRISSDTVHAGGYSYSAPAMTVSVVAGGTQSANLTYAAIDAMVTISISGLPTGVDAGVVLTGPGGYSHNMPVGASVAGLAPGSYTVTARSVTSAGVSYAPSVTSAAVTAAAGTNQWLPITYAASGGSLALTITGATGDVTITGPGGYTAHLSTSQTLSGLAAGTYTVTATPVTAGNYTFTPSSGSQTRSVSSGATTTATVAYAASSGALTVTVTGATGSATVSGPGGYMHALSATTTLVNLAPGTYTVAASSVVLAGTTYNPAPASQTAAVTAGSTASATVAYTASPASGGYAAMTPGFHAMTETVNGTVYHYQLFIPKGYDPTRPWPVILSWHDSGVMGTDNTAQLTADLGRYISQNQATFPMVAVLPQNPGGSNTPLQRAIFVSALDSTEKQVNIDRTREYLTGASQGGVRTWGIAYAQPTRFAAFAPMAGDIFTIDVPGDGTGTQAQGWALAAQALKVLPIWAYHGSLDTTVPVADDRAIYQAFLAAGSTVYHYTEYAGVGHDVWDTTYADPNFWAWLSAQHR